MFGAPKTNTLNKKKTDHKQDWSLPGLVVVGVCLLRLMFWESGRDRNLLVEGS